MRTRPISINNSLVHGICNYRCRLCAVNKPNYRGPREHQRREVTAKLIERVREAAAAGIHVRYLANAGDGEPTLHPEFRQRMAMFGDMLRTWYALVPPPEVSVVTNGSRLTSPGVLETFAENPLSLIVSLPTTNAQAYGELMVGDAACGSRLLAVATHGIDLAMQMHAEGRLQQLYFHISPPEREVIRRDFPRLVEFLVGQARAAGLGKIELIMFPATSNRSGLVRSRGRFVDTYRDLFRRYAGRSMNGVTVRMQLVLKRFFACSAELVDLLRRFRFPCLWNANPFITAAGDSICCNDQAVHEPQGSIMCESIAQLMTTKESSDPGPLCLACDQRPEQMRGSAAASLFALAARLRMDLARRAAAGGEKWAGTDENART